MQIDQTIESERLPLFRPLPVLFLALPLLAVLLYTRDAPYWASIFPRAMAGILLVFAVLSLKNPIWSVPAFLTLLGPLQTFSRTFRWEFDEYPLTLTSIAVWALSIFWVIRRPRGLPSTKMMFGAMALVSALWGGMILGALPSLEAVPGGEAPAVVTPLILITGLVEPFILFLVVRSWLKTYGKFQLLVDSLIIGTIMALLAGIVNYNLRELTPTLNPEQIRVEGDVSSWRFHFMAFGGANLVGLILVLLYPLCFLRRDGAARKDRESLAMAGLVWAIALASFSRATPICLALETALLWLCTGEKRLLSKVGAALLVFGLSLLLILPRTVVGPLVERFTSTDLVGYFLGDVSRVSDSDAYRNQLQHALWDEIIHRPSGGYAATGTEDPESLLLDIPLQLGWIPVIAFIVLEGALFVLGWRVQRRKPEKAAMMKILLCMWFGFALYNALTGSNISKVVVDESDASLQVNAVSTLILTTVLALYTFLIDSQPE